MLSVGMDTRTATFVQPKTEPPVVVYQDDAIRVVKTRTQIHTGEWNKELIIEHFSGTDALGNERWVELTAGSMKRYWTKFPHEVNWRLMGSLAAVICDEEDKDDYDYIFYINKGRYRVKGEDREELL
jgi:hypothetical protein